MRILCLSILFITLLALKKPATSFQPAAPSADSVYICLSQTSYAYHSSSSCRGLNRCSHPMVKVSLRDAINKYGHRACRICE